MKSFILVLTLTVVAHVTFFAQQDSLYYYQFGEKVYLNEVEGEFIVEFADTAYSSVLDSLQLQYTQLHRTIFQVSSDSTTLSQINDTLCTINPFYLRADSSPFYIREYILLEWNEDVLANQKQIIISHYNLRLAISAGPLEHYEAEHTLETASQMYETGHFKYCYPEFLVEVFDLDYIPNDEYFDQQWYLHNTGQLTNDGHYGTADADIDAPAAWDITTGSADVVVAVIDRGVTPDHPDLPSSRQIIVPNSNADFWDEIYGSDEPFPTNSSHGNAVAGIIAATHDNDEGIAGICPNCKIMPFKYWPNTDQNWSTQSVSSCVNWARQNNANVINISLALGVHESLVSAINSAIDEGIVIVAAAGNFSNNVQSYYAPVSFPANMNNVISVGASDRNDLQANYSPTQEEVDLVAPSGTAMAGSISGEAPNIWTIDTPTGLGYNSWPFVTSGGLPAQYEHLPASAINGNHLSYTGRFGGTSAATPMVAGVVALMLSVNPCLTPEKIKNILLNTADKVGGYDYDWNLEIPGHSLEMGYGRLNAHAAVLAAMTDIDLYTEDIPGDGGVEPNNTEEYLWESEDIWVRNQDDGISIQEHENPEYIENEPIYVYVRIRNRGCNESLGSNDELRLYWAKAATSLTWPDYWNGSITSPALMGDIIDVKPIPAIPSNDETILTFEWYPPNPENYDGINDQPWHFCLLTRIISNEDPIIDEISSGEWSLVHNVSKNNNISWKNISIIEVEPGSAGGSWDDDRVVGATVAVGNATDTIDVFDWSFKLPETYTSSILDVAEVRINLDSLVWTKWVAGGKKGSNIKVVNPSRYQIRIEGDSARLDNISFTPHERGLMNLSFNFLTRDFGGVYEYDYHLIQQDAHTHYPLGGEKFEIHVEDRELFMAEGGDDREIYLTEQVELSAEEISEDAIYNWYDPEGNLIHTGKDLIVSPQISTKYRLEVIAESDGFKDYDEIEVVVKTAEITSVSPNPVSSLLTVEYDAQNVQSAYLVLTKVAQSGITNNYILNVELEQTTIDVSSLPFGIYNLILVADGTPIDQTNLLVE